MPRWPQLSTLERIRNSYEIANGCWIWRKRIGTDGYGHIRVAGKECKAHRVSYECHIGPIPKGMQLDHLCRTRACINPRHLEVVTQRENLRRGDGPSGVNARKTHCINGHELAGDNLYIKAGNIRRCRICIRAEAARHYSKKKHLSI